MSLGIIHDFNTNLKELSSKNYDTVKSSYEKNKNLINNNLD